MIPASQTNPNLEIGICGEHGGEPSSVEFCYRTGMNYVSCSPYRVPIARLAAAQAAIAAGSKRRQSRTQPHRLMQKSAVTSLGLMGLPAPISELAARKWDALIVGGGHNGLTCAAYLARAGKRFWCSKAVNESAALAPLKNLSPNVRMSPCAYLAGLLHPLVIEELGLPALGYSWSPASNGLFVPFEDGSSIQLYDDDEQCEAEVARLAPRDVTGWRAMNQLISRTRDAIRPANEHDFWIGEPPTREQMEERLGNDEEARKLLFTWSMAEFVEHYLSDERLQIAYLGPRCHRDECESV